MCGLAYIRRAKVSETEDFEVTFKGIALSSKAEIMEKPEPKLNKALTIFLIISILLSIGTLVYIILTPKEGEHFTEFYILGPQGKADNYPTNFSLGQSGEAIVGIVNHEYSPVNYTMEMKLQNQYVSLPKNFQKIQLAHNETWEKPLTVTPPVTGQNMKLEFLLFNETEKNISYRTLYLWINVEQDN